MLLEFNPEGLTVLAKIPSSEAYTSSFSETAHEIEVLKQLHVL